MMENMYTVKEVMAKTGMSRSVVYNKIANKEINAEWIEGRIMIPESSISQFKQITKAPIDTTSETLSFLQQIEANDIVLFSLKDVKDATKCDPIEIKRCVDNLIQEGLVVRTGDDHKGYCIAGDKYENLKLNSSLMYEFAIGLLALRNCDEIINELGFSVEGIKNWKYRKRWYLESVDKIMKGLKRITGKEYPNMLEYLVDLKTYTVEKVIRSQPEPYTPRQEHIEAAAQTPVVLESVTEELQLTQLTARDVLRIFTKKISSIDDSINAHSWEISRLQQMIADKEADKLKLIAEKTEWEVALKMMHGIANLKYLLDDGTPEPVS